jgi:hypothetical protein
VRLRAAAACLRLSAIEAEPKKPVKQPRTKTSPKKATSN